MKIYVITLNQSAKRQAYIKTVFSRLQLEIILVQVEKLEFGNSYLSNGELGCLLSHTFALNTFLKTDDPECMIFEDDVMFHKDFDPLNLPRGSVLIGCSNYYQKDYKKMYGAFAYKICRTDAIELLDLASAQNLPIDNYWNKIRPKVLNPPMCIPDRSSSDIQADINPEYFSKCFPDIIPEDYDILNIQDIPKCTFPERWEEKHKVMLVKEYTKTMDTAICIAYWNPCNYKRTKENLTKLIDFYFDKLPIYVYQLVYDGIRFEDKRCHIFYEELDRVGFFKEAIWNKLAKAVKHENLLFLDSDILFADPDFITKIRVGLDFNDVLLPYSYVEMKDQFGTTINKRKSLALVDQLCKGTAGFALACRREYILKNPFFQFCILGGGDIYNWAYYLELDVTQTNAYLSFPEIAEEYKKWQEKTELPEVGFLDCTILHLFHGYSFNRQYESRYTIIPDRTVHLLQDIPVFHAVYSRLILRYFRKRNEDIFYGVEMNKRLVPKNRQNIVGMRCIRNNFASKDLLPLDLDLVVPISEEDNMYQEWHYEIMKLISSPLLPLIAPPLLEEGGEKEKEEEKE